ncbi:TPA: DUF4158 domain-containing protein [Klebsiella pneumoniae]|nr:hypothetical protein AI3031V1_5141 [Klebsiella pneumoniae]HBT3570568.1 DUF4158 domain-containing protein [Klebsiella pneumoniae]
MAFEERVQILSEAEQDELYGPPAFTSADQRFFFSLNDKELAIAKSLRHRGQRYMLVVLLGYFKAKPVVLNPGFHQIKQDLKYVGNDSNLLIVFYVQIVPDDFVMQLHRF